MIIKLHNKTDFARPCGCKSCCNPYSYNYRRLKIEYCVKDYPACGQVVIELSPQYRTILVDSNKGFARVAYPYCIMVISYRVIGNKYIYEGVAGGGLMVFFKNSPLVSLEDRVGYTPIEEHGLVCTPHQFDGKSHDSVSELIKDVINIYFGITHSGYVSYNDWKTNQKRSLFDFLIDSLYLSINSYSGWETIIPPKDSILVNLDFFRENKIDKILDSFIKEFQKSS